MKTVDLALDRERLEEAVTAALERLRAMDEAYAASSSWLSDRVLGKRPAGWIELLRLYTPGEPLDNFALLLVAMGALRSSPRKHVGHFSDLVVVEEMVSRLVGDERIAIEQVPRMRLHHGDLRVDGTFVYDDPVMITGTLEVRGAVYAGDEYVPLYVGGDLRATAVATGSSLVVGGDLLVEKVVLADYQGEIHALGALRSPWAIESPLGGEIVGDTPHVGRRLDGEAAEDPGQLAALALALGVERNDDVSELVFAFIDTLEH